MSEPSATLPSSGSAPLTASDRHFLLRRLHSLTGILPIGAFMLFHFFENASARSGAAEFNATVLKIAGMPYVYAMEIFLLAIPIAFHSLYGIFITASSRPTLTYGTARNWAYMMQRISGMIGLVYIVYHVVSTRVWSLVVKQDHITFQDMHDKLSNPIVLLLYVVGIVALTFHFANGLWSFSITWGLVRTRQGQNRLAQATMAIFAVLCIVGLDILSAFVREKSILAELGNALFG